MKITYKEAKYIYNIVRMSKPVDESLVSQVRKYKRAIERDYFERSNEVGFNSYIKRLRSVNKQFK